MKLNIPQPSRRLTCIPHDRAGAAFWAKNERVFGFFLTAENAGSIPRLLRRFAHFCSCFRFLPRTCPNTSTLTFICDSRRYCQIQSVYLPAFRSFKADAALLKANGSTVRVISKSSLELVSHPHHAKNPATSPQSLHVSPDLYLYLTLNQHE